jgi:hypothetical protein
MIWRSISEWVDDLTLSAIRVFEPRAFRASGGCEPPDLESLVRELEARPPAIRWPAALERRVGRIRLALPTVAVDTFFDFHPARDRAADTLYVYHHGLGEFPHDGSAARILTRGALRDRVDWIAIKGPGHEHPSAVYGELLLTHATFARGLLASVFAARAIATYLRPRYRHVVLGGMSMGGVITLIEAALPGGSAFDLHVPLMAGPDLESVMMRSGFSRVICSRYKRRYEEAPFGNRLEIVSRLAGPGGPPIRAVLARYDRLFMLEHQRPAYGRIPRAAVEVIAGGHLTAATQFGTLGAIVESYLERELWSKPVLGEEGPVLRAAPAPAPLAAVA